VSQEGSVRERGTSRHRSGKYETICPEVIGLEGFPLDSFWSSLTRCPHLQEEEKEHFVALMRKWEAFHGMRVVTYSVMSNHCKRVPETGTFTWNSDV